MLSDEARQFRRTYKWEHAYQKYENSPLLMARSLFNGLATLPTPDFHHELEDLYLDEEEKRVCIVAPRDHAKSTLVAELFPLHHIVFDEGDKLVLIVSKTQKEAKRRLRTIKDMIHEPKFRYMFGHIVGTKQDSIKWNTGQIMIEKEYEAFGERKSHKWTVIAKGMKQATRGIKEKFTRPTYIALDDPEDEDNTKTAESMNNNYSILIDALEPATSKDGQTWVIGTPLHQKSMVFRLKNRLDWTHRHYSAEADKDGYKPGEVSLWPEKWSWEELMEKKESARRDTPPRLSGYFQEWCCEIQPDEDQLFQKDALNWYKGDLELSASGTHYLKFKLVDQQGYEISDQWHKRPVLVFSGIDPAASTSSNADYFVIFHIAIDPHGNRFVLPYFRKRVRPTEAIEQIVEEYHKFKPERMSIETSAQQEVYRDVLRNRDDVYIPGLAKKHNPTQSKESRHLELLEPYIASGKVFLQRNMRELVDEMMMHPKGDTDDLLDGMYYAFLHARKPRMPKKTDDGRDHGKGRYPKSGGIQSDQKWMLA